MSSSPTPDAKISASAARIAPNCTATSRRETAAATGRGRVATSSTGVVTMTPIMSPIQKCATLRVKISPGIAPAAAKSPTHSSAMSSVPRIVVVTNSVTSRSVAKSRLNARRRTSSAAIAV